MFHHVIGSLRRLRASLLYPSNLKKEKDCVSVADLEKNHIDLEKDYILPSTVLRQQYHLVLPLVIGCYVVWQIVVGTLVSRRESICAEKDRMFHLSTLYMHFTAGRYTLPTYIFHLFL